ncbi:hypothetical protein HK096_008061, partial [Nowakowskiella sp. JEL0078]
MRVGTIVLLAIQTAVFVVADNCEYTGKIAIPNPPVGSGKTIVAPQSTAVPFVDNAATNTRGDPCHSTLDTNAGVRVVSQFLKIWSPSTLIVDAGVTTATTGNCTGFPISTWSGIPGDATDGKVLDQVMHKANIDFCIATTTSRTASQNLQAYLDDRRQKAYSISDGMGILTTVYRTLAGQTTTITSMPDSTLNISVSDSGNNYGVAGSTNLYLPKAITFVSNFAEFGSTEPAKRFYKYGRPFRWSKSVIVSPNLIPAISTTPTTDGGFISGHSGEAVRFGFGMAYIVPVRFQEMIARAVELGHNRIVAGMHSPMDVIGGRILATAVAAASISTGSNKGLGAAAVEEAYNGLIKALNLTDKNALFDYAHSTNNPAVDRFADHEANKRDYLYRLTFGLPQTGTKGVAAVVPKGSEVLLESRQPYLDALQRREVLRTTAIPSGYILNDDAEGWGRLNYFEAADGYKRFDGDVFVTMNASLGGFNAIDSWRNDISGVGKLTKAGTGILKLTGSNSFSGGIYVVGGELQAQSRSALGTGCVYLKSGKITFTVEAGILREYYTQRKGTTLTLKSSGKGSLHVNGLTTIEGGNLIVEFDASFKPKLGQSIPILRTKRIAGRFDSVTVKGYVIKTTYTCE